MGTDALCLSGRSRTGLDGTENHRILKTKPRPVALDGVLFFGSLAMTYSKKRAMLAFPAGRRRRFFAVPTEQAASHGGFAASGRHRESSRSNT